MAALGIITPGEEAQLAQTIEMFEVITQSQPSDYQSLEILKEAYLKLGRHKDVINTSKRIAQAYVQLGQLSSAILEYETILQRYPDDPDVLNALAEIESKATSLTAGPVSDTESLTKTVQTSATGRSNKPVGKALSYAEIDDGRQAMQKLLVEGKVIGEVDFNSYWPMPPLTEPPGRVIDPLLWVLHEKGLCQADRSIKLLVERTRLGYLPLDKYDIDMELARSFPKDVCQRWCILPFDKMSKTVLVATLNPYNKHAADELQAATSNRLLWYLAHPSDLVKTARKVYR